MGELKYDLLDAKDAGTLYTKGNADTCEEIMFFMPGFPDDQHSNVELARDVASKYGESKVFLVLACLPEYDRVARFGLEPIKEGGYSPKEIFRCTEQAVERGLKETKGRAVKGVKGKGGVKSPKVTLIGHDFGTFALSLFASQYEVNRLVLIDTVVDRRRDTVREGAIHFFYMGMFGGLFYLSRFIPKWISVGLLRACVPIFSKWPLRVFFLPGGVRDLDFSGTSSTGCTLDPVNNPYLIYPYWTSAFSMFFPEYSHGESACSNLLLPIEQLAKRQPTLFLYGEEKNTNFHSEIVKDVIKDSAGGRVIGVKEAAHWCHRQQKGVSLSAITEFIFGKNTINKK